jgi:hypothetical protein
MGMTSSSKGPRAENFKVHDEDRPGWIRGNAQLPRVGESVYCAGGEGRVISVRGKTGDGSCLLQIEINSTTPHFFAAASNVLVNPSSALTPKDIVATT